MKLLETKVIRHDNESIRRQLADAFGIELTDRQWHELVDGQYLQEVIDGETTVAELVAHIRKMRRTWGSTEPVERPAAGMLEPRSVPDGGKEPVTRQTVMSYLIALEAAKDDEVHGFRSRVLGGHLLTPAQVGPWVEQHWHAEGSPTLWLTDMPLRLEDPEHYVMGRGNHPLLTRIFGPGANPPLQLHLLRYHREGESVEQAVATAEGSILEQLRVLSVRLSAQYSWSEGQATAFVLTGHAPWISAAQASIAPRAISALTRITLQLDPALTPHEVAEEYRRARRYVVPGRYRELSPKHLWLALFAALRQPGTTWAQLMSEWNRTMQEAHPTWTYEQATNFGRDCGKAIEHLMRPGYVSPTVRGQENGQTRTS
jgi:hypothetical protein